ncbi:MAG: choice-of-anchor U domain-containing protein [Thermus sp.]|nr:choice-of-anchor U domain-containing protein [Thermus sp.]
MEGGSFLDGPRAVTLNAQGYRFPYGGLSFTARVAEPGGTLTVTLSLPRVVPGMVLVKCTETSCFPVEAQFQGNSVRFRVQDGGPLDADGRPNGEVRDPIGLGEPPFTLEAREAEARLAQGGRANLSLRITPREDFEGRVEVSLAGAPPGLRVVSPSEVEVRGREGPRELTITLEADGGLALGRHGAELRLRHGDHTASVSLQVLVEPAVEPEPPAVEPEPAPSPFTIEVLDTRVVLNQGGTASLRFRLNPRPDFEGVVTPSLEGAPFGLRIDPPYLELPIRGSEGPREFGLTLRAEPNTPLGTHPLQLVVSGGGYRARGAFQAEVQAERPSLRLTIPQARIRVDQGGRVPLQVRLIPMGGFTGEVRFHLLPSNPEGVRLEPETVRVTDPNRDLEVELQVQAADQAMAGAYQLTLEAFSGEVSDRGPLHLTVTPARWTVRFTPTRRTTWKDMAHGEEGFLALTEEGHFYWSPDGLNWQEADIVASTAEAIAYGSGRFVAVSHWHGFSEDGLNWTSYPCIEEPGCNVVLYDLTFGMGRFVGVGGTRSGEAEGVVYVSEDGRNWRRVFRASGYSLQKVLFAQGRFIAWGTNNAVLTSTDGETWSSHTRVGVGIRLNLAQPVVHFPTFRGNYVAVHLSGDRTYLATSFDGVGWSLWREVGPSYIGALLSHNGLLWLARADGRVAVTPDGEEWTHHTLGPGDEVMGNPYMAMVASPNRVVLAAGEKIFTSP